ncbi:MAG: YgiQ family radical SAM protein [Desulfobacteraceae bacterium IS3]|nr:MAG: YgiQ family radical SAM protein [Desulfobacteraceae bacterium IS3]
MFLPTTHQEIKSLGWKLPDIILVSGDTYIDSSYIGVAVIGRVLLHAGYSVAIIAQPDIHSSKDICRLGEPGLFWGVTGGCVDSMISNYTAVGKRRQKDDLTPGGMNTRRPDRAVIAYTNLIRRYFKNTKPIVLGGIEASLRRISHYDYRSDSVKRSVLFDAKADIIVYGMGEKTVLELASRFRNNEDITDIRGLCYISSFPPSYSSLLIPHFSLTELPSHEAVSGDKQKFIEMFRIFYENTDPFTAKQLYQKQDTRYLVQNPPQFPLMGQELDEIYELPYQREVHPFYRKEGEVRALETIRFSITTHRGCYGECRFCAITAHQGRIVTERSEASILREAALFAQHPDFKGIISDVGGPTANMYATDCPKKKTQGACQDKHCLFPEPCKHLSADHVPQMSILNKLRKLPGIKKVFIASGIRCDLILRDKTSGQKYLEQVIRHHVSGQMKIAPEHSQDNVLKLMGKPGTETVSAFKKLFDSINKRLDKKQFLTYYFIVAHPGCSLEDMRCLRHFVKKELRLRPEQIQIFTPSPSTWSALMYYTETDPFTGNALFVEKNNRKKEKQKHILLT